MTTANTAAAGAPRITVIDPRAPERAKLRVAAYARVSSDSDDQINSYIAQVDFYSKYIASKRGLGDGGHLRGRGDHRSGGPQAG